MVVLEVILAILLALVTLCLGYLYFLTLAGVPRRRAPLPDRPVHTFAIAIPAHNEEAVIGATVDGLLRLDYPREMVDIHVVSDNSTDRTAEIVRQRGVACWERFDETRRSKGYALAWLFERLLRRERGYDAIVVFDADSRVDASFLRVMDAELSRGRRVVQGHHVIANPADNWFTAAMYVGFVLDNLRNGGRSNLGLSAKLMGDGMCFAREVLERFPWTTVGLTEDAEYQARLLLNGVRVAFAPDAVSYGEIPTSLSAAQGQRSRWMQGRAELSRRLGPALLRAGLRNRSLAQLDGAVEQAMPSYSTLLTLWGGVALIEGGLDLTVGGFAAAWGWVLGLGAAFALYPLLGLLLSGAPRAVYRHLALAPLYVVWRTGVRLWVRLRRGSGVWVRTPRKAADEKVR
ncbi:MAG TPA: glycosyltransferase [Anaerolineales bacterium]|nr:glycosyltransferase [Anaerolineae bacterium]HIQ01632.1 glycosyltransferase [Anaerolineales bacterium]